MLRTGIGTEWTGMQGKKVCCWPDRGRASESHLGECSVPVAEKIQCQQGYQNQGNTGALGRQGKMQACRGWKGLEQLTTWKKVATVRVEACFLPVRTQSAASFPSPRVCAHRISQPDEACSRKERTSLSLFLNNTDPQLIS